MPTIVIVCGSPRASCTVTVQPSVQAALLGVLVVDDQPGRGQGRGSVPAVGAAAEHAARSAARSSVAVTSRALAVDLRDVPVLAGRRSRTPGICRGLVQHRRVERRRPRGRRRRR